ncbi:MAG TPA: hypothetical protein VHP12_06700 [Chitinophagaceae bacterium]|nr:hypothetical protein [Chitinophagaceae bacterium]
MALDRGEKINSKPMKKTFIWLNIAIVFLLAFTSCSKDAINETKSNSIPKNSVMTSPTGINGNFAKADIHLLADGTYYSAYGPGLNFGGSFIHPLNISSSQNGQLYTPYLISAVTGDVVVGFAQSGPYFTVLLATGIKWNPNVRAAIKNYQEAFVNFINWQPNPLHPEISAPSLPTFSSYATQQGISADGFLTVTGQFVLDNTSPTNVSIYGMTYVYTPPPPIPILPI